MTGNHWTFCLDDFDIAWLTFDREGSSANTLDPHTLRSLDENLSSVTQAHPNGLVILSGKPGGYIAGADVKRFAGIQDKNLALTFIQQAQDVFARLENLAFPTLAAIHGYCLGGGLELALSCRYRICTSAPETRLGFPEVRLGIFPAFGGSVRSIRCIGDLPAMELMLTGRSVDAGRAKKIGLVDEVVPRRQLESAARTLLTSAPRPHRPNWKQRAAGLGPVRPIIARQLRKRLAKEAPQSHYPATWSLVEHWQRHARRPAEMYRSEADRVADLVLGDSAQNLVRAFLLQDRLKRQGDLSVAAPRRAHVVGGGIMGGDIAAWCALHGMRVSLQDRSAELLVRAMQRARGLFQRKLKDPRLVRDTLDLLSPDHRGNGIAHADLVIEAIFEDVEAKQNLFRDIEAHAKPDAILATNTSSIPLETIGQTLKDPSRLVGLHFFNPVAKMPLLEIVRGAETDPRILDGALAFSRRIKKMPIIVKSSPGFLVNRILMPYLLEAFELLSEGIPAEAVDLAAVDFGMPMGPIELADTVGLDICLSVASKLATEEALPQGLREMVDEGRLGKKSGKGFYRWQMGKPLKQGVQTTTPDREAASDRLVLRMLNEAVACLHERIVENEDLLDAGVIFGTGFAPFRGGPLNYIHAAGAQSLLDRLQDLEMSQGERFAASNGWRELVDHDDTST